MLLHGLFLHRRCFRANSATWYLLTLAWFGPPNYVKSTLSCFFTSSQVFTAVLSDAHKREDIWAFAPTCRSPASYNYPNSFPSHRLVDEQSSDGWTSFVPSFVLLAQRPGWNQSGATATPLPYLITRRHLP